MSMGLKVPSKEIRVTDPDGVDAIPTGDPGELWSFELMVWADLNKPEETEKSFVTIDDKLSVQDRRYSQAGRKRFCLLRGPDGGDA